MYKPTGFLARKYAVTNETIQNWIKEGKFERVKKTKGGHYRIWVEEDPTVILYGRISRSKQKSSLKRQEKLLKAQYPEARFLSDVASGFNQNRRGYKAFLEHAINGDPLHLVATHAQTLLQNV